MKKNGFAVSGIIYGVLILFFLLIFSILSVLESRKMVLDKSKNDVLNNLNNVDSFKPSIESVSFEKDSWEIIKKVVSNEIKGNYAVGDTKKIQLNGVYSGEYLIRIANISNPKECSGTDFSQSACGYVFEFVDLVKLGSMHSGYTNKGGWPASEAYKVINDEQDKNSFINALPLELKDLLIKTKVVSGHASRWGGGDYISFDKLFLLSSAEIWGNGINPNDGSSLGQPPSDSARNKTRQLDYYLNNKLTILKDSQSKYAIKKLNGVSKSWWTRSIPSFFKSYYIYSDQYGDWHQTASDDSTIGFSPAFKLN